MAGAAAVKIKEVDLSSRVPSFAGVYGGICIPAKKGRTDRPELVFNDGDFLNKFTPDGRVNVGYDLSYYSALAFLERSTNLYVKRVVNEAYFAGVTIMDSTNTEDSPEVLEEVDNINSYAMGNELLLIHASSEGAWGNDVAIKITTHVANPDLVPEPESFLIQVFKRGALGTPVESFYVSAIEGKLDGYGRNMFVEDVLNASNFIRAKVNTAVDKVYPKEQATHLYLGGGDDGLAVTSSNMVNAVQDYKNPDNIFVNVLFDGGYAVPAYQIAMDNICIQRQDCVAILSTPFSVEDASDYITQISDYRKTQLNLNSSYSALYTTHVLITDRFNDRRIYVSPDGYVAGQISFAAANFEIWSPVAGFKRGILNVEDVRRRFEQGEMDVFYNIGVNPIRFTPGRGITIWGQKTLLSRPSALDRLNVRLLLIVIEPAIKAFLEDFLFELNTRETRSQVVAKIESYMDGIRARKGVTDYQVICDESNNLATDLDNNRMNVDLYIKPSPSIEEIPFRVVLVSQSTSFSEAAGAI
jgi:hypothetical protein